MFKKIRGYDYEISDSGEVRNMKTGKMLKPVFAGRCGHFQVKLSKDKKQKQFYAHRLVLTAFIGPCPKGMEACHNNGNAKDNRVTNLRWDTSKNNVKDVMNQGTHFIARGSKHWSAKLTEEQVKQIRVRYKYRSKDSNSTTLSKEFKVSFGEICDIVNNKIWKHVE